MERSVVSFKLRQEINMIKKQNPFYDYEFDYEEKWINDLASKDLLLCSKGLFFYHFENSESVNRKYRIIPKKRKNFNDEEISLFKDGGWEYLFEDNGKSIFYTDKSDAIEIFTDDESYMNYMKKTIRGYSLSIIAGIFVVLIWVLNFQMNIPANRNGVVGLAEISLVGEVSYIILLSWLVIHWIFQCIGYYKSRKRIIKKNPVAEKIKYRNKLISNRISSIVLIAIVIITITGLCGFSTKIKGKDANCYNGNYPVMFREFDPEGWEFVSEHLKPMSSQADKDVRYKYSLNSSTNFALTDGVEESFYISETMNISEAEEVNLPEYTSLTYNFRSEKIAKNLLLREIGKDVDKARDKDAAQKQADKIEIDVSGADYAGFYTESDKNGEKRQHLYLRKGKRVVYAEYRETQNLLDKLQLFAK